MVAITHGFVSAVADDPAAALAGKVLPSHWNDDHDIVVSATSKVIGRKTAGAGAAEELSLSEVLDLIGSAAQGDILYRGASAWARLGAGTSGQVLKTNGAAANPSWATLAPVGALAALNSVSTAYIDNDAVTYAKLQNISAQYKILARKTSGAGDAEECSLSEILDFVTSAVQGDILYRGASGWTRLGAGTSGQFLKTQGAGANPLWADDNVTPQASTGEIAAASAVTKYISPDRLGYAPMLPKAWAYVDVATSGSVHYTTTGSYNLSAGSSGGSTVRLTFGTAMANTNYGVILLKESGTFTQNVSRNVAYVDIGTGDFIGTVLVL